MVTLVCALVGEAGREFCVDAIAELKAAIKEKRTHTITCAALMLDLYLAKTDGAWLTRDGAAAVTLDDHGNLHGYEKMAPSLWIKNDRYFGERFQLNEGEIHVLVVLPRAEREAKQRWKAAMFHRLAGTPPPTETIAPLPRPTVHNVDYVSLPAALLVKCGLLALEKDMAMMYCRRQVRELWDYIHEQTILDDARVFIVGPSGTGKSFSALCFVTQLDPSQWNVVWIHFAPWRTSCLSMGSCEYWKSIDESTFVVPRVAGKRLFVCLDGYTKNPVHHHFLAKLIQCVSPSGSGLF